jgi:hypothetical protein
MKIQLSHISILRSAKIVTAINAVIGLGYTLIGIALILLGPPSLRMMGVAYLFGPIFTALFGFLGFCLVSFIYNTLSQRLGGIEVEVKICAPAPPAGTPPPPFAG